VKTCEATTPPTGDRCGKPATTRATFSDDDQARLCTECALAMQQTALAHSTKIKLEKIQ
jgi:hypothetical protein